jgi:hypothetical protein|tara:strand:- start:1055 stop:1264 length:210 start_codon:yes stop_codon:yes gene_type:complete
LLNIDDKLQQLEKVQLIQIIKWSLNDTENAATNYKGLDKRVKSWCAMLNEAIIYQIDKAYNKLVKGEEQ